MAIKLLVSAFESSGKSTITSQLEDVLVFNLDHKEYGFKVPHANIKEYESMDNLIEVISEKLTTYKEKFGKYPKTVVFDTVTQMYSAMQKYNADKYKGFDIHTWNNKDTLNFNEFIENSLIPSDINVIVVAHTIYDEATSRHIIPASGAFAKAGSWLSVVNDAIFIEKKSNKLVVHTSGLKYPARTTLEDLEAAIDMENYSLQDHINRLSAVKFEATEFAL
ncbi:MAG: hypothetical protein BV457_05880 [Thermoplasmata archaeon M9B1D]|nr:MAG: hypothetical protein BV457_05880 [Thermoplasmata archaeon M9B1D]PNX51234.1 MAG: hypothetical protein BV456_04005 [Thermoplasmata archaeon M8B2D]